MAGSLTISSQKPQDKALDYEALRAEGINIIEQTSSNIWTDYNVHDPGVTILELLCYALTDLSYRANNSIPDLLATAENTKENILKQFFSAAKIFPNKAVTINDFRKIIIDVEGVKNAWLQKRQISIFANKSLKRLQVEVPESAQWTNVDVSGYYDVLIELDLNVIEGEIEQIKTKVRGTLMQNRNLCEDFLSVEEVKQQKFRLCTEIELNADTDPFDAVTQMFFNIQNYLTPIIKFYSLDQLLSEGLTSDAIFEGPLLEHGFIKKDELLNSKLKTEIHLSDVMQQMLNVSGLGTVLDVVFNPLEQQEALLNKWVIAVMAGMQPVVDILASNILVYKNGMPLRIDLNVVKDRYGLLMSDYLKVNETIQSEDITFSTGEFSDVGNYHSIQNDFPKNYGVSHWGLPENASAGRVAQAKQLQAYLYFFDQHLANSFSQLANIGNLFSSDLQENTYFSKVVKSFKDSNDIFLDSEGIQNEVQSTSEDRETFYKRRNLFLDHMLARYGESFSDYVNVLYSGFTSNPKDVIIPSEVSQDDIIQDKANFLKNYPEYSANRFSAFDYTQQDFNWDSTNVSGLEKRLEALLGIQNLNRKDLANLQTEILEEPNELGKSEYWFRITDYRDGSILLEGVERLTSEEQANLALETALSLIYQPENIKTTDDNNETFYYQLMHADKVVGRNTKTYTSKASARKDIKIMISLVTESRANEGLFLIEHLLLLPPQAMKDKTDIELNGLEVGGFMPICVDDDYESSMSTDPYSFRISLVLPAYAPRFLNIAFRQYAERTIRMEAPAHTFVKICWVGNEQLIKFQNAYKNWLDVKSGKQSDKKNKKLIEFIDILTALKSIYPVARLRDCSSSEERTLFMLNQNALGTLKT